MIAPGTLTLVTLKLNKINKVRRLGVIDLVTKVKDRRIRFFNNSFFKWRPVFYNMQKVESKNLNCSLI